MGRERTVGLGSGRTSKVQVVRSSKLKKAPKKMENLRKPGKQSRKNSELAAANIVNIVNTRIITVRYRKEAGDLEGIIIGG